MSISRTVSEILSVNRDLEIWVRGHSRSLFKLVPIKSLGAVSLPCSCTVIMAVSLAVYEIFSIKE